MVILWTKYIYKTHISRKHKERNSVGNPLKIYGVVVSQVAVSLIVKLDSRYNNHIVDTKGNII